MRKWGRSRRRCCGSLEDVGGVDGELGERTFVEYPPLPGCVVCRFSDIFFVVVFFLVFVCACLFNLYIYIFSSLART